MDLPFRYYAHTLDGRPEQHWQGLLEHLEAVASIASEFADVWGAAEWGRLAGLWHDLGKYSEAFQSYLHTATSDDSHQAEVTQRVDHSTAGAQHAAAMFPIIGHVLAYAIAGHHAGLHDAIAPGACLDARLDKEVAPWMDAAPRGLLEQPPPKLPEFVKKAIAERDGFSVAFFARMTFSCLVDADFLDTEAFMAPERRGDRPGWPEGILDRLDIALDAYVGRLERAAEASPVDQFRAEVRTACVQAASREPGLFSLTVPTGGGKTLSSLAFALKHATTHGLRRVVYVAPFTSIIEQNADVFRRAADPVTDAGFPDPVVEHHSSLDPEVETATNRLASENWDAPIVVTTAVQFYESLFANRTSRCRKLHNLADSVIIMDEAQALPVDFLQPCLTALDELQENYGATVVLCTATQPAVNRRDEFPIGLQLDQEREIVPEPRRLFEGLKRVEVQKIGVLSDEELAERLVKHDQVLCIVNTRGHAHRIARLTEDATASFHLSALMCPEHRSVKLEEIRRRLQDDRPCKVISTRLIEAGVDIDFPVVYRSMAGLDSIAQAAGRCNRNGNLDLGHTIVFESEHRSSERFLADTANSARQVLELYDNPLDLDPIEYYFRLYYWDQSARWDSRGILQGFKMVQRKDLPFLFSYSTVAHDFRLIDDPGQPVIVPWGEEGERACRQLRYATLGPSVQLRRKLQRYTVQVSPRIWTDVVSRACEVVHDTYAVLASPELHYSDRTGLNVEDQLLIA